MKVFLLCNFVLLIHFASAQVVSNISCTSAAALQAMKGQHDPMEYAASDVIDDHSEIICALRTELSPDSLKAYLVAITDLGTRHSYSDTVSNANGIGAARRWAFSKFGSFSAANEGRLIPGYLQFDYQDNVGICGDAAGWRNVLSVLPGRSTADHGVVLIEAHLDSRCADLCDATCSAEGAEDNGSGVALVLELARVLSRYTFNHTLVFMLTTAEEHGLVGAKAMAQFCSDQNIEIKAVLNNDVVGGVLCGSSSSPPSCPGPGDVDSLNVRIFSNGTTTLSNRSLARTIKMFHQEKLQSEVPVHMSIEIMNTEDRAFRGGDHIPFRESGFSSIRFTAANEHGDGDPSDSLYTDRQHTSDDILGVDTDGDQMIDSFFVDFNYLQRNAMINGMATTLLALGPEAPSFTVFDEPTGLRVGIDPTLGADRYRVGVRGISTGNEFLAVYRTSETSFVVPGLDADRGYYISVAAIDEAGIMGPFSPEVLKTNDAETSQATTDPLDLALNCAPIGIAGSNLLINDRALLPCYPNPTTGSTVFSMNLGTLPFNIAYLTIGDAMGRELIHLPLARRAGKQELQFTGLVAAGVYTYKLIVDGRVVEARSLVVLGK